MAEGQLDVAVTCAAFKEAAAIQVALGYAANQVTDADLSKLELRFSDNLTLAVHDISIAKNLLVHRPNDLLFSGIVIARDQLEWCLTLFREAFDP